MQLCFNVISKSSLYCDKDLPSKQIFGVWSFLCTKNVVAMVLHTNQNMFDLKNNQSFNEKLLYFFGNTDGTAHTITDSV